MTPQLAIPVSRPGRTGSPGTGRRLLLCLGMACGLWSASAQNATLREYELKAGVLFNIIKYVEWPADSPVGPSDTIEIGLLGTIPFPEAMDVLDGKVVQGRKLQVRRINSVADAAKCRVLYVGSSEKGQLAQIAESFKDKPVLTVGEVDGFAQKGGMVNLLNGPNRIVMEINRAAATQSRIEFSSQLLKLARLVSR
ncbi:MAG: YfiR family protein [Verrucomicrobiales bacterium]|nr:YfiR family protein [Verrucomicrobiales bacterium]